MAYVDGFLVPVPTAAKDDYKTFAETWAPFFKELGALQTYECWGDDVPAGKVTDFRRAVELKEDETVVFSWTIWPDKATRDAAWAKMMEDDTPPDTMPFDGKRMIFGGFEPLLVVE
ncbi:MAG: DUF1428 domain-containing protein [Pseudomonadota bacterium]